MLSSGLVEGLPGHVGTAHGEVMGDGDFKPTSLLLVAITAALSNADCERVWEKKIIFFFLHRKEWIQHCQTCVFLEAFFDSSQRIVYKMAP